MAFYKARFGDPPLRYLEVSPLPGRFGQGFTGMIYLPTVNYLAPDVSIPDRLSASDRAFFQDLLVAHEIAHQWWGNTVTSVSYHHEWLMEALSSYSAVMYMETTLGPKADESALEYYRKSLFTKGPDGETAESEGPVVQGRRLEGSNNPNASNAVAYGKGMWVIHMLRRRMGDARSIRCWPNCGGATSTSCSIPNPSDCSARSSCRAGSTDPKLENFFDDGSTEPAFHAQADLLGERQAGRLQTDRHRDPDRMCPDDFSVTVPVEIQTGRGKVVQQVRTGSTQPTSP